MSNKTFKRLTLGKKFKKKKTRNTALDIHQHYTTRKNIPIDVKVYIFFIHFIGQDTDPRWP